MQFSLVEEEFEVFSADAELLSILTHAELI